MSRSCPALLACAKMSARADGHSEIGYCRKKARWLQTFAIAGQARLSTRQPNSNPEVSATPAMATLLTLLLSTARTCCSICENSTATKTANDHDEMRSTRGTNLSVRCQMTCAHEEGRHTDDAI